MNKNAKTYILITLLISWIITIIFFLFNHLVDGVLFIMITPAVVAFVFRIKEFKFSVRTFINGDGKGIKATIKAFLFALIFPIVIVSLCAFLAMFIFNKRICVDCIKLMYNTSILRAILLSFVSFSVIGSFGEEFGWRGYLLPELNKDFGKVKSSTIVGIVWALFHFPVLILLTIKYQPLLIALVIALIQALAAFVVVYSFNYCYFISKRVYPTVVMHGLWNLYNPYVLGSVYFGTQGFVKIQGPVYLINGEGVFGIIFAGIAAVIFIILMNRDDNKNKGQFEKVVNTTV